MSVLAVLHRQFVPSHDNAYRPPVLRRNALMFFIAAIIVSESLFVSSLFAGTGAQPASPVVAAVGATSVASTLNSYTQSFGRSFVRFAVEVRPMVPWILGCITALMIIAIFVTFFTHIQIQQPEMLFSAALVAVFALTLLVTNAQVGGLV